MEVVLTILVNTCQPWIYGGSPASPGSMKLEFGQKAEEYE